MDLVVVLSSGGCSRSRSFPRSGGPIFRPRTGYQYQVNGPGTDTRYQYQDPGPGSQYQDPGPRRRRAKRRGLLSWYRLDGKVNLAKTFRKIEKRVPVPG